MSSNEFFLWIILTISETLLILPFVLKLIKRKVMSESDYYSAQAFIQHRKKKG